MMPDQPGNSPPAANPYAPPAAPVAPQALDAQASVAGLVYVGFAVRGMAQILDWVIGIVLAMAAGMVSGVVIGVLAAMGVFGPDWATKIGETTPASLALGLLGSILYHALGEGLGGATLGKVALGMRVRSEDGSPARFGGALLRSLAFIIDGLFFGLVAYGSMSKSRTQQRLGDKWGHTVVVRNDSLPADAARSNLALGLVLSCVVQMAVTAIDVTLKVL